MGVSVSASVVILMTAGLVAAMGYYEAVDRTEQMKVAALDDHYALLEQRASTSVDMTNVTHNITSGVVQVSITNTGSVTLDLECCQLMVNGTLLAPSSVNFTENGHTARHLFPGANILATSSTHGLVRKVSFIADTGRMAFSTEIYTVT